MARKSYSKKGRKLEPAVMTMTFSTSDTVGGAYTIDLSQAASIANRRFYRQGINWAVASIKVISGAPGSVFVHKLPTTWVLANAWKKGFQAWMKEKREALSESESVAGRFMDFKIYADSIHHQAGYGTNLLPLSSLGTGTDPGEWIPARINYAQPGAGDIEFEVKAVGGNYGGVGASGLQAVSLIDGYSASRALPSESDPNTPGDADDMAGPTPENWLQAMMADGTGQDRLSVLRATEYDEPPYPFEGDSAGATDTHYPGGPNQMPGLETHDVVQLVSYSGATNIGTQILKGGNFPCGLMRFVWTPESPANLAIQVNLVPGNHRGYLCEPMGDM